MAREKLRLGLVGFGRLARQYYLPALAAIDGAEIVALADTGPGSRRAAAASLPALAVYDDHREMLAGTPLDGVLVASPPSTHLAVWRDAAVKGIPAFVEKPLLLVNQLEELAPPGGDPRVMVDFNRRFWPTYLRAASLVRDGRLGVPVRIEFRLHLDVLAWSSITRHRFSDQEGGLLHDLGCHAADLMLMLTGEQPEAIAAMASSMRWLNDRLSIRLFFPSGNSASCDLAYGKRTREQLTIHGAKKSAVLLEPNAGLHVVGFGRSWPGPLGLLGDVAVVGRRVYRRSQSFLRMSIQSALASFVRGVASDEPFEPGWVEGAANARCLAAAAASMASDGAPRRPGDCL